MSQSKANDVQHPPFLREIVLKRQHNGSFTVDRVITNRGTFELLEDIQEQLNAEVMDNFAAYVKSLCWEDIVEALMAES